MRFSAGILRLPLIALLGFLLISHPSLAASGRTQAKNESEEARNALLKEYPYVSEEMLKKLAPYLMPRNHPLRKKLDKLFSSSRPLSDLNALAEGGFIQIAPQPNTKVVVAQHIDMKGYIFKLYMDDQLNYYRNEPEFHTWMLRARGAQLVREEIAKRGWQRYFKAPIKWIYRLPKDAPKSLEGHLQKNFILVEEKMDILSHKQIKAKWRDGTMGERDLDRLFQIINTLGLRGACKWDNVPICKDGRIAFVDTQNHLRWPVPYMRLFPVLPPALAEYWRLLFEMAQ